MTGLTVYRYKIRKNVSFAADGFSLAAATAIFLEGASVHQSTGCIPLSRSKGISRNRKDIFLGRGGSVKKVRKNVGKKGGKLSIN